MSLIGSIIIAVILLVLDVALGGLLSLGPVRPSLTLPFVVYIGLREGPIPGTLFGGGIGLCADMIGALPLGATSFIYAVIGFTCGKLWQDGTFRLIWPWGVFLSCAGVFSAVISHYLISRGSGLAFLPLFLSSGLPGAVYTTILGLLWFLSPLHRVRNA